MSETKNFDVAETGEENSISNSIGLTSADPQPVGLTSQPDSVEPEDNTSNALARLDTGGAIEAILIQASQPVTEIELAEALQVPVAQITDMIETLSARYSQLGSGFELKFVAGGWRYWSKPEYAPAIENWVKSDAVSKLSQAALETLSVVAYLQPISRQRISAIRGVNVDSVIRTLMLRGLIEEAGQDTTTGAQLFATTGLFLEKMGLASLEDLPPLAPLLPDATLLAAEITEKEETSGQ